MQAGFWGEVKGVTTRKIASFVCPDGYCCADRSSGCAWDSDDACQGNRRQQYPFCGGCLPSFSQAIDGVGCVANAACGGMQFARYLLLQLFGAWMPFTLYALYAAAFPALISRLPSWSRPAARGDGGIAVLVYFFQMAVVVVPSGYDSLVEKAAAVVGQFSMLQELKLSYQGSTCAVEGTTAVHKLVWQLCLPLVQLLLLPIVSVIVPPLIGFCGMISAYVYHQCCKCCCSHWLTSTGSIGEDDEMGNRERLLQGAPFGDEQDEADAKALGARSWRKDMSAAVACVMVFSFTSFAESVLRLLRCVEVNDALVLYYAGAVKCQAYWQWAPGLLLAMLLGGPLYIIVVWELRRRPLSLESPLEQPSLKADGADSGRSAYNSRSALSSLSSAATMYAHSRDWPRAPVWQAAHTYSKAPFRDEWMHWAGVMMLQRLLTVMCQSLPTEALGKSLGVTAVSFIFALLQVYARPFHSIKVNRVQLTAMMCLTLISMLSGAQAAFETAGVDASKAEVLATIVERADWMMFGLLLLPPLLFLLPMEMWQWCGAQLCICECGASDEGDKEQNRVLDDVASAEHGTHARLQTLERRLQQAQLQTEQQWQRNEQLLQEKEQERQQEKQRHEQEKEQLLQEKQQEKERHKQEKAVLLASLEELQEQGAHGAGTGARSGRKDLYRTFDPGEEGAS
jgi:hypothetical protein